MATSKIDSREQGYSRLIRTWFFYSFLNRTNRSGIINGGPIGGIEQKGDYKIDCRFNREDLILRIKRIGEKAAHIRLLNMDAIDLIDKIEEESKNKNIIFYFDPPYYLKASSLYLNHYQKDDHQQVSERIKAINSIQWIVSYDNVSEIKTLYRDFRVKEYSFFHKAYESRIGKEVLFFSSKLKLPKIDNWEPLGFKKRRLKSGMKIVYRPNLTI